MPQAASRQSRELLVRSLVYVPVLLLFSFQIWQAKRSSDRAIGIFFAATGEATEIDSVRPRGPAAEGGLRAGDVVLRIAGRPIAKIVDYDAAADDFARDRPVAFEIRRGDEVLTLSISPGVDIDWGHLALNGFLIAALYSMGILSLARRPGSLPANLLHWLFFLCALEVAQPFSIIGASWLTVTTALTSLLLNGAQFGTMLHLACLIPQRQRWLRVRPRVVPLLYATGFGLAALTGVSYLLTDVWERDWLPPVHDFIQGPLGTAWYFSWATLLVVFLGLPALRHPTRQGRKQAGLVLLGALPWVIYTYLILAAEVRGVPPPDWLASEWTWRISLLTLPLSIFIVLQIQSMVQNTLMMRLTTRLQSAGSVEKISELISSDLNRAFHTKCNYVFFRAEAGSDLTSTHSSGARVGVDDIPESYEILKIADRRADVLVFPDDLEDELPEAEASWLRRLRARLVVPVMGTDHRLIGLLILGEKASEEPYIAHDLDIVRSLAGQIALAYENIGLQVQVHERDRIQREVLERFEDSEIYLVKECSSCGRCYDSTVERCEDDGSPLALTLPVERTIDGRYRLDKVLGKGGVAVVYRALDERLNRVVAVKVLARSVMDAPDASRRFEREARIVAKLAHPRIVTIHDFGKTRQGCAYLVMEFLEGTTLGQRLRQRGPYAPALAAELFDQILDGLGAAHRMGVVHRDLKPDNVMIGRSRESESGESSVKLLDFGLAKFHASSGVDNTNLTMPGFIIGTLAYMAPEQLIGQEADERSDLFAVGVMVSESLTGAKPFSGRTPAQVLDSITETGGGIPGGSRAAKRLNAILRRCLAAEPADRYTSAEELREILVPAIRAWAPASPDSAS